MVFVNMGPAEWPSCSTVVVEEEEQRWMDFGIFRTLRLVFLLF